jgi:D-threonate/D-erythronate kinase
MMPAGAETSAGVCVVADDLTGAADTAVYFLRPGEEIVLVPLASEAAGLTAPGIAGLAIDTGTRGSSSEETVLKVRRAAGMVRGLNPALVYKKLDSQLRGLPGLEIEALRRELGLRCALVAPAHPDQDRLTRGGVHLVRGVPVADAEPGRDPVAPVTESRLPVLIARQAGVKVAHVLLADLEGGPAVLCRKIEGLVAEGYLAITFDAVSLQHLKLIAEVGVNRFPDALLAGSAGLAMALAACRRTGPATGSAAVPRCESMLFVCGSTARALRRQAALLVDSGRCRGVTMTPLSLVVERCRDALILAAGDAWERHDVVLQTSEDRLDASAFAPSSILAGLADLAMALVGHRRPDGIFLSGGDTATAVLSAAGVAAVRLRGEVLPGMAWGVAVGGTLGGVTVVTKSGAFGRDEDLVALHQRWRKGATNE